MTTATLDPVTTGGDGFRVRIGKVWGEGVVGNSPGPLKTVEETALLFETTVPMVTLGSITSRPRMGNPEPRYWEDETGYHTFNVIGLANRGIDYYCEALPGLVELSEKTGKPLIVSLAPEEIEELEEMVELLKDFNITIELNYSCPNIDVIREDTRKSATMWALEPDLVARSLERVRKIYTGNLVAKFIYHPDDRFIDVTAKILRDAQVNAVALINTLDGSMIMDPEKLRPLSPRPFGGLSGRSILPVGLGTVARWSGQLDPEIDIIAEGGIASGFDILSYFVCGANVCRVGSEYGRKGRKIFGQLTMEFAEEMTKRGLQSLADIPSWYGGPNRLPVWQPV
jgi:dihydroorotate dehydrogenase